MSYTALYREWRPKKFEDVVGQEHITTTIKNQIKEDKVSHAYLLCGTRGTGKTSTAKIMAKAVNCPNSVDGEPCDECDICKKISSGLSLDVIELDAASNNRVDNIRELIDEVQYPPQEAKYKVYIIDEVHMLSIGAVNAFLKTLEEPPKYVIFILATTDPQKLPITILSRCQRFDFKRIRESEVQKHLRRVVEKQGMQADDQSLELISRVSDGALRDALSLLDQVLAMSNGVCEYNTAIEILGLVTNQNLIRLMDKIIDKDMVGAISEIDDIILNGKDIHVFIKDFINHLRNCMISKVSVNPEDVLDMSNESIEIITNQSSKIRTEEILRFIKILQDAEEKSKWSTNNRVYLELAVIKMIKIEYDSTEEILLSRINRLEKQLKSGVVVTQASAEIAQGVETIQKPQKPQGHERREEVISQKSQVVSKEEPQNVPQSGSGNIDSDTVKRKWKDILETFKAQRKMVVYASLVTGKVGECRNGEVEIVYEPQFEFNKSRLEKEPQRTEVNNIMSEALGERVRVKYSIIGNQENAGQDNEELLRNAFGGENVQIID